jgi:hypothetical protein
MFHSPRQGWIDLLYKACPVKKDENLLGVFGGPAIAAGISPGFQPVEDTDGGRRSPAPHRKDRVMARVVHPVASSANTEFKNSPGGHSVRRGDETIKPF